MFFSKRAFNALNSSSHCPDDKAFLLLLMFRAFVALMIADSRVSYLLSCCALPRIFYGLSLRSYPCAVSTPCGAHPSVRPRSPRQGGYVCVPSFPSRQESAEKFLALPLQMLPAAPA